jgi:Domain of unknown function (DUF4386)
MTRTTNARIAGVTFLLYIALGIAGMVLSGNATGSGGTAEKLASIAQHLTAYQIGFLLELPTCFAALVLGITLYAITRDQDADLAMLALVCRVCEGVLSAVSVMAPAGILWLEAARGAGGPANASAEAVGTFLFAMPGWMGLISATFFAVGSTLFAYLLLRGQVIPLVLGWLGIAASLLLVVCLPLQVAGLMHGPFTSFMWIPMAAFEVPLGLWLLIKGAPLPTHSFGKRATQMPPLIVE